MAYQEPRILFPPYGTQLEPRAARLEKPSIADPRLLEDDPDTFVAHRTFAEEALLLGCSVATTNTFSLRHELHRGENGRVFFQNVVASHVGMLLNCLHAVRSNALLAISLGPKGDCYNPERAPSIAVAHEFHRDQVEAAKRSGADFAWFETIGTVDEAVGIARAAHEAAMRTLISFVIDGEGRLLSGETVSSAISHIQRETHGAVSDFGLNCCPIEGMEPALRESADHAGHFIALYPNASSHPQRELQGLARKGEVHGVRDPTGVAGYLHHLAQAHRVPIIGGCCGFNFENVREIARAVRHHITQDHLPVTDASPAAE